MGRPTSVWTSGLLLVSLVVACVLLLPTRADASPASQQAPKEDSKISSVIRGLLRRVQRAAITGGDARAQTASLSIEGLLKVDADGSVQTYVHITEAGLDQVSELEKRGVRVELVKRDLHIVQGWIPLGRVEAVAELAFVGRIQPPVYAHVRTGSRNTEGDSILRANLARSLFGLTGAGIKVGVISDGADSRAAAQATGDLPAHIEIDPSRPGNGDEGTAMMEIVHDLAPGAQLAFAGPSTSLEMIEAVEFLAYQAFGGTGAHIVVDDLGFFGEPYFEDGPIAQAVRAAVLNGTVYVSSAGNDARRHYEADYAAGVNGLHDYGGGDHGMSVTVSGDGQMTVLLQWNDRFGVSGNDYDLWVCPAGWNPVDNPHLCEGGADTQNGDDDPSEPVWHTNTGLAVESVDIFIGKPGAAEPRRLEMFILGDAYMTEFGVPEGSIFGHPAVPGAVATGAIDADDPGHDTIEYYSSHGPSEIFFPSFESRDKPDVVAIDGVSVTGAGDFPEVFFGTSAAAPHVAGVAALMLEALRREHPALSKSAAATAVFGALRGTAIDLGEAGPDSVFGFGRVDALEAVRSLVSPTPAPTPTAVPSLSMWGFAALGGVLALLMVVGVGKRAPRPPQRAVRSESS